MGFPSGSHSKVFTCNEVDLDFIPGLGKSSPGGHGNPLQYSCLENPRDGGAWWAAIYRVAQSQTWLKRLSSSSISSRKIGIFFCNHLSQKKQLLNIQFSSVQSLSHVRLFATPWIAARQASLSIINSQSLLKLMSIELVMPSNHLILCHPFSCPQSLPASRSFPMLSISPLIVVSIYLPSVLRCSFVGCIYIYNCNTFLYWSFDHHAVSFFVS